MADVARVHLYNVVTATGIAQAAATAALALPDDELTACVAEWQRRRDVVIDQLRGWSLVPAAGGWSMLLDVGVRGYDSFAASARLLERGRVAATPMRDWGERNGDCFVRLVFSNEPAERLTLGRGSARPLTSRPRVSNAFPSTTTGTAQCQLPMMNSWSQAVQRFGRVRRKGQGSG
jgi:aspartate/methionine/tyrosine aminotransferase